VPSPCGPNSQCKSVGESPSCSCLENFVGSPPNCKPECIVNSECPSNLACLNQKCKDPCPGVCGSNAECRVVSHIPMCYCSAGFTGDPFSHCETPKLPQIEHIDPCDPTPCGANAICRQQNNVGSCQCVSGYEGDPYQGCRPECTLNSDCPSNKACQNYKCYDPCPGTCGQNAICGVVNHIPDCNCIQGYEGDPYRYCSIPEKRKF
jgi:hypothetical protein